MAKHTPWWEGLGGLESNGYTYLHEVGYYRVAEEIGMRLGLDVYWQTGNPCKHGYIQATVIGDHCTLAVYPNGNAGGESAERHIVLVPDTTEQPEEA